MIDRFYENIGGKLKDWAKGIFVIEAVGAILAGLGMLTNDAAIMGLLTIFLGPIIALVSTYMLYAFGELVEKTAANEAHTRAILEAMPGSQPKPAAPQPVAAPAPVIPPVSKVSSVTNHRTAPTPPADGTKNCPKCGQNQRADREVCWSCGHYFDD